MIKKINAQLDISSATGGYTHTDPSGKLTETTHRVRWEGLASDTATRQVKAVSISGNFTHFVTVGFDSSAGTSAVAVWQASDTNTSPVGLLEGATLHGLSLYLLDTGSVCKLQLIERDGSTLVHTGTVTIAEIYRNKALFLKVNRTSSSFTATIYRDAEHTEQLYQISQTLNSVQTYSYLSIGNAWGEPALTKYESYETGDDANVSAASTTNAAQTFTPSTTHDIVAIDMYAFRNGTGCSSVYLQIFATSSGHPTGSALATSTTYDCTGWSTSSEWHRFWFTSPATVTSGTKYAIVMKSNGTAPNVPSFRVDDSSSTYSGGNGEYGATWTSYTWDHLFKEYGGLAPYIGTANGFSSELYIGDTPTIWTKRNTAPIMKIDHSDGFSGFPNSDESWTVTGDANATAADDTTWDTDGDGHSLKITATDGTYDKTATFNIGTTTYSGGVLSFKFKLTALGENQISQICSLIGGAYRMTAYVQDVSGTKYFRMTDQTGAASSSTAKICELDTIYTVTVSASANNNGKIPYCTLVVDGTLCEYLSYTAFTPASISLGYAATNKGGTRYYDELKYMNGSAIFPSVCRGGASGSELIVAFNVASSTAVWGTTYFIRSTDNGETWTQVHSFAGTVHRVVWDAVEAQWLIFTFEYGASPDTSTMYSCPSFTGTVTFTEVAIYSHATWDTYVCASREITNGKLLVGVNYFTSVTEADVYSALIDTTTGEMTELHKFGVQGDVTDYENAAEPQMWVANGVLRGLIRFSDPNYHSNVTNRYRTSDDLGVTDWYTETLIDPGTDWFMRTAWMRAFLFRDKMYWVGRDSHVDVGSRYHYNLEYDSFVMKTDMVPNASGAIPLQSETWELSLGLGGNGDIDAVATTGHLWLDVVNHQWGGSAFFMQLDTGEIGNYRGVIWF